MRAYSITIWIRPGCARTYEIEAASYGEAYAIARARGA
jgi:hypothetical protein